MRKPLDRPWDHTYTIDDYIEYYGEEVCNICARFFEHEVTRSEVDKLVCTECYQLMEESYVVLQ